jgi:glucose-1-phosphatase
MAFLPPLRHAGRMDQSGTRDAPAPRAVVFDLGKVLLDFDYAITVRRVAAKCRVPPDQILRAIDQSHWLHRFETGLMTADQFYTEVRELVGYEGTRVDFEQAFGDVFSEIRPMIGWHARLTAAGVPTFIFSNTNELAVRHITARFPFFARFDGHVYSYQHGAMKPHARLYKVVEQVSGLAGNALFYLDDRRENVAGGRARGWQAVHHVSPENSIAAAVAAGLPG